MIWLDLAIAKARQEDLQRAAERWRWAEEARSQRRRTARPEPKAREERQGRR
jgi:hypothetical protein